MMQMICRVIRLTLTRYCIEKLHLCMYLLCAAGFLKKISRYWLGGYVCAVWLKNACDLFCLE